MLQRLLETGPAALVPLAWLFALAATQRLVTVRTVLIAHLVMVVFLVGFLGAGWRSMTDPVLSVWRLVILVGIPITAAGLATIVAPAWLFAISLYGWMVVPALALLYTGWQPGASTAVYVGGGLVSLLGAAGHLLGAPVVGLIAVGIGQTAGIVDAAFRH